MRAARLNGSGRWGRAERIGLGVLYAFTVFTLFGYATFGLHPSLLARFPGAAGFYGIAFDFFAQAHVWLAWTVLALFLTLRVGGRWLAAFGVLYAISLASELAGTTVGLPFGEYRYTEALGAKWFGHVPLVIPLSWFFMALPSYALARAALPAPGRVLERVLLGSLVLLSWDLCLDPAMSRATAYWVWGESGRYYGMPWLNLFGWYVTGLALMGALLVTGVDGWLRELPVRWLGAYYGANLLLPLGMAAAAGLWGAVAATLVVVGATALGGLRLARGGESMAGSPAGAAV